MTQRTQLTWRGKKGATKPDDVVIVARPSRWGNPYRAGKASPDNPTYIVKDNADAVRLYREWLALPAQAEYRTNAKQLKGKRLACYCKPDLPCHADVLAEIAEAVQ